MRKEECEGCCEHNAAISGTLTALVGQEWQPINTAEKEHGNKILAYGDGYVFEAECEEDDGYRWWCNIGGATATHWMPLPSPPNSLVESERGTQR